MLVSANHAVPALSKQRSYVLATPLLRLFCVVFTSPDMRAQPAGGAVTVADDADGADALGNIHPVWHRAPCLANYAAALLLSSAKNLLRRVRHSLHTHGHPDKVLASPVLGGIIPQWHFEPRCGGARFEA